MRATVSVFRSGLEFGVQLSVGVQSFTVNGLTDEGEDHARWMAQMLLKALQGAGTDVVLDPEVRPDRFSLSRLVTEIKNLNPVDFRLAEEVLASTATTPAQDIEDWAGHLAADLTRPKP